MLTMSLDFLRHAKIAALAAAAIAGLSSNADAAVVISSGATVNIACASGVCSPTKKGAVLNITQLQSLLASGNVTVTTAGAKSSDIVVLIGFSWASANSLTLDAYQSITIEKPVAVDGTGAVNLVTNDGGTGGSLSFGKKGSVGFLSTANSLTINANAYTLVNNISTLASDIAANAAGNYALANSYNAKADGRYTAIPIPTTFQGTFEGLGNTISSLFVKPPKFSNYAGLFMDVGTSGQVSDLRLVNARVISYTTAGGIAVQNDGTLSGDSVTGLFRVIAGLAGAIAGTNNGTISNSVGTAGGGPGLTAHNASGIAGLNMGTIINSSASGYVGGEFAGVLVSNNQGNIYNSYSTGTVSAVATGGGLVGENSGTISNCYSTASVISGNYIGGLVGTNTGTIADSFSSGRLGLDFVQCGCYAGGFVGTGTATGFVDDYWDTSTSGIADADQGDGTYPSAPGITGLTAPQLQSGLPSGFSSSIWGETPSINSGLPYLLANPPA